MPMLGRQPTPAGLIVLWAVLMLFIALTRPLISLDELRYMSVAWELFDSGQAVLLTLNTEAYLHKPPLLFWLVEAGWWLTGVNEVWPRLLPVLLHGATLWAVARLSTRLWPGVAGVAPMAAMCYLGFVFPTLYATALSFDALVVIGVLVAATGLWSSGDRGPRAWLIYGLGLGLGMLAKGPIVYLYLLPALFAAPWWMRRPRTGWPRWYLAGVGTTLVSTAAIGIWLVPLALSQAPGIVSQLIEEQVLGRISESVTQGMVGHHRPVYWYLLFLPVLLPWLIWGPVWRGSRAQGSDPALRFLAVAVGGGILALSLISNKQVHYLLPVLALITPAVAIALIRSAAPGPWSRGALAALLLALAGLLAYAAGPGAGTWGGWLARIHPIWIALPVLAAVLVLLPGDRLGAAAVPVATLVVLMSLLVGVAAAGRDHYDLRSTAAVLSDAVEEGRPLAYLGNYQGQFHFLGRIPHDIEIRELFAEQVPDWLAAHPEGLLVTRSKRIALEDGLPVLHRQPYRSGELLVIEAAALSAEQAEFRNCWPRFQTCEGEAPAFQGEDEAG